MDRLSSGTSMRLAFRTKKESLCELHFWSQSQKDTEKKPIPCSKDVAQKSHIATINDFEKNDLYSVQVIAWESDQDKSTAETLIVHENGGQGLGKEIYVVRFNRPLNTAEIHLHNRGSKMPLQEFTAELGKPTGCQTGLEFERTVLSSSKKSVGLEKVSTYGFGISASEHHPQFKDRLLLKFNTFQPGQPWEWFFSGETQNGSFLAQKNVEFFNVKVKSEAEKILDSRDLNTATQTFQTQAKSPVKVSWSHENLPNIAYVIAQIGTRKDDSLHCIFEAKKGEGSITKESLATLKGGQYEMSVTLYAAQIKIFPNLGRIPWLIASYDWRAAKIQKI